MIYSHSEIWTPETIRDIHARTDGKYSLSGYRAFREPASFDDLVFLAAGLTRFPLEGYKEKCKTETILGPRCSRPLVIDLPIYVVGGGRSLSNQIRAALAVGSSLANTALSVDETALLPEEKRVGGHLIYQIQSGAQSASHPASPVLKAGAIQVGVDQMSADSLRTFIRDLRGEQEHRVPVFVRIGAGHIRDEIRFALNAGADGVVLLGMEASPVTDYASLRQYCRIPMMAALSLARQALQENKALGEVSLIAGNGIMTGADAAKALALGADAIAIRESALVALRGSSLSPPPPHSPPAHSSSSSTASSTSHMSPEKGGGERVAKYINSMIMEVALLARSLGKGDVHSLEYEDLAALTIEASLISGVKLAGE